MRQPKRERNRHTDREREKWEKGKCYKKSPYLHFTSCGKKENVLLKNHVQKEEVSMSEKRDMLKQKEQQRKE